MRDSEYESWLARRSAVDADPAIAAEDSAHSHAPDLRRERTAYMFPMPGIETALKAYEIFGNAMYQGYGQTELLPVAMLEPP